jgi:hypothetical protein
MDGDSQMARRIYEKPVLVKRDLLPLATAGGTNGGNGGNGV